MPQAIMGPPQELSIQPGTVQCFSVPDHANSAASLILRNLFQPGFKVWPHNDVSPFAALCFGRDDSLSVEFYVAPFNLLDFRPPQAGEPLKRQHRLKGFFSRLNKSQKLFNR
jgi:hypothetical protein